VTNLTRTNQGQLLERGWRLTSSIPICGSGFISVRAWMAVVVVESETL